MQRETDNALKNSVEDKAIDIIDLTSDIPGSCEDDAPQKEALSSSSRLSEARTNRSLIGREYSFTVFGCGVIIYLLGTSSGPIRQTTVRHPTSTSSTAHSGTSKHQLEPSPPSRPIKQPRLDAFWSCSKCTLHNELKEITCGMCGAAKPGDGWKCPVCTEEDIPRATRVCPFCGIIKLSS